MHGHVHVSKDKGTSVFSLLQRNKSLSEVTKIERTLEYMGTGIATPKNASGVVAPFVATEHRR